MSVSSMDNITHATPTPDVFPANAMKKRMANCLNLEYFLFVSVNPDGEGITNEFQAVFVPRNHEISQDRLARCI